MAKSGDPGADKTSIQNLKIQIRRKDGKIFGPYSRREVLAFVFSKKLDGTESILLEGTDRWKPLNSDTEFFDALQEVLFGIKPESKKKPKEKSKRSAETHISSGKTQQREVTDEKSFHEESTRLSGGDLGEVKKPEPDLVLAPPPDTRSSKKVKPAPENPWILPESASALPVPSDQGAKAAATKKTSRHQRPLFLAAVLVVMGAVIYLQKKPSELQPSGEISAQTIASAPAYFRPLLLRYSALTPLKIPPMPETLRVSAEFNLPQGLGAQVFVEEIKKFATLSADERLDSEPWARLAWSLRWMGEIMSAYSEEIGGDLISEGNRLYGEISKKARHSPEFEKLYGQIDNISRGRFAEVQKELPTNTDEYSRWLKSEIGWFRYWKGEVTAEDWIKDFAGEKFLSTALESTFQVKKLFFEKSPDTVFWLDQLAIEDPESYALWFVSAEYFWRIQSAYLQKSYLFWVSGLGAISLYPKSYQTVFLGEMSSLIKLFGRQEPARQISENATMISEGNIVKRSKQWHPIFGESIDPDQLTDEILDSGSSHRLAPIRLASLQNLAFTVSRRGGRKFLQVGYYWIFEKNYKRALETFDSATTFEDAKLEAWGSKVWLYSERFQFDRAFEALDKVNSYSRGSNQNEVYDAILHFFARDYDYAKGKFEQFLKGSPGSGLGHYFYARLLEAQGKNVDCAKAAYLGGSNGVGEIGFRSRLLFYRCRVLAGLQMSAALADLEKMYQSDPSNTAAVIEYIRALGAASLNDKAIIVGREAVEKFPRSYELRLALGDAYLKSREYDKALAFYNHARRFRPESPEAFVKIADLLNAQDRFEDAAGNYRVAAQLGPEYPEVWLKAAQAYRKAGKKEDALFAYNKELEVRPSVLQTFLDVAEYLLELSSPQAVLDLFQKYQSSFNDDPRVSLRLAQAYLGLHNYEKARERAAFAQNKLSTHPEPYRILGILADIEGNYPGAKRYLQQYLKLLPQAAEADAIRKKLSQPPYTD